MAGTSRLILYNLSLLKAGERSIDSLTVNEESRKLLDVVWNNNGVNRCLEEGQWFFAMRTIRIDSDPTVQPDFGYRLAFQKPDDWVLTSGLCSDEYFRVPLLTYTDEAGYWYSETDPLYVRYVSSSDDYGNNLGAWPDSFTDFVAADFAWRIIAKLTDDDKRKSSVHDERKKALGKAKGKSMMSEPSAFPAQGSWTGARNGWWGNRGDRGNRGGSLIG